MSKPEPEQSGRTIKRPGAVRIRFERNADANPPTAAQLADGAAVIAFFPGNPVGTKPRLTGIHTFDHCLGSSWGETAASCAWPRGSTESRGCRSFKPRDRLPCRTAFTAPEHLDFRVPLVAPSTCWYAPDHGAVDEVHGQINLPVNLYFLLDRVKGRSCTPDRV
jgi:hypothetical protein